MLIIMYVAIKQVRTSINNDEFLQVLTFDIYINLSTIVSQVRFNGITPLVNAI
jgi:hypothetical protein